MVMVMVIAIVVMVVVIMVMVVAILVIVIITDERGGFLQTSQLPSTESPLIHISHG